MTILYIILGILGYILIGSITYIVYKNIVLMDDDTIFWALGWPLSLPLFILGAILMFLSAAIEWLGEKMEGIFKKRDEID